VAERSFYITTPIYYVNGRPHIGHAYTTIAADAIARWHRLNGRTVRFLTGTDEHGQKVLDKARERGMDPKAHVDDMVRHWKAAWDRMEIRYDHFIRTTDAYHTECVQDVMQRLYDGGFIHQDTYTGWYSKSVERFWTEKDLIDGKCPETGQPVEKITETNYFFKMSAFQDRLVAHLEANPDYIRPASRKNEVLGFLRRRLEDLCISRPKSRMAWGIEIPFDTDFVTYVWFDALLNYVSGVGYPDTDDVLWDTFWPVDFHLIGKDILTTHSVYWSTMLMALDLPLPKCIYAHGWWMSNDGSKMSKSLGNVIDINLLADEFGVDATRYFFLREIAFGADGGFTYDGFLTRYNADLANDLGNLAHRSLSMSTKWLGDQVPAYGEVGEAEDALRELAAATYRAYRDAMEGLQYNKALEALWELVKAGNKYIDTEQPWSLNREGKEERLRTVMRTVQEVCAFVGALLLPVMPAKAEELLGKLGQDHQGALDTLSALAALDGSPVPFDRLDGLPLAVGDPLFPRFRELPPRIAELFEAETEPPPPPTPKPKPHKPKPPPDSATITFEEFGKVQLRAGTILSAEKHPNADKLVVMKVDVGEEQPRTIVAGIATRFAPEDLPGKRIVVVVNLAPAKLRGVLSEGMLLAAGGKEVVDLVTVDADPGEVVR
jgi:methionyl-tRNA synthetase